MNVLRYASLTSLDGYFVDEHGRFDWAAPDAEVHAFVNDLERPIGTHLYGRRLYEVMVAWETMPTEDEPPVIGDYAAVWKAAEKVVFSRSLPAVASARTRLERDVDADSIRRAVAAADGPVSIGGAELAAVALRAGLVTDLDQFISPVIVGGGRRWLPDDLRVELRLVEERHFGNGVVYLHYRID